MIWPQAPRRGVLQAGQVHLCVFLAAEFIGLAKPQHQILRLPGKVKAGNGMETSVKLTILYILIELEDKPMVELDKINEVFKIRGVDVLAKIKEMC